MKFSAAPTSTSPRARDDENRLVPLINVVFLMLIFFLLVGTIRSPLPQSVVTPVSTAEKARVRQAVTVTVDEKFRVYVNSVLVDPSEFDGLANRVRALWPNNGDASVTRSKRLEIRADKNLTMKQLGPIIKMLSGIETDEFSLVTQR